LELSAEWRGANGAATVPVRMDARTDVIGVHWQGPVDAVRGLTAYVREHPDAPPPRGPGPITDPKHAEELRGTIQKLVPYLRRVAPDVDVSSLASEEAQSDLATKKPEEVEEALETIGLEGTGAKLYFICPETKTPVRQGGRVVMLEQLPPAIVCENHPAPKEHRTRGITRIRVEEQHRLTPVHYMWIALGPYFVLTTWVFAELTLRYPGATILLYVGYGLSALAPVATIFSIYGREAFEAATDLLSWMLKPLLRQLGRPGETNGKKGEGADGENNEE
jgi:hypothetical protein